MINKIREYFLKCPFLDANAKLGVDYLTDGAVNYSLNVDPSGAPIKKYTDGSCIKGLNFSFKSHEYYSSSEVDNTSNLEFYYKLERWIKENNEKGIVPELDEQNQYPQEIEVLTSGYLFDNDEAIGQYVIQLRLIYMED
ncbi:hypothetical protein [Helcococcus kunzii]|uniref:hypothetical protein n=1 Tax=Helcococcus kunzii TaxID=40091 RepID=UPI001BB05F25|nr:hypothetical protein [Helcococcus kunzii]QUY65086.1 hypothetical protein GUI37_05970 [Helcococcus kunzii]